MTRLRPLTWVTLAAFLAALAARELGAPPWTGLAFVAAGGVLLVLGIRNLRRDGGLD